MDVTRFVDDRPEDGVFRVNRAIFTDAAVFEAEMARLFEGGWVFLGLESQAAQPHDFFTTFAGRVPVLVQRCGEGVLRAFVNSCPHKGARLAQTRQGHARLHVCPITVGASTAPAATRRSSGKAPAAMPRRSTRPITAGPLPRFAAHRGFLFGSVAADVPPLEDYLGEAAHLLDLVADQSAEGWNWCRGK
jgi:benzoate/toluate 1,2-dioxygenase alpha subunit